MTELTVLREKEFKSQETRFFQVLNVKGLKASIKSMQKNSLWSK